LAGDASVDRDHSSTSIACQSDNGAGRNTNRLTSAGKRPTSSE
jgi:hypothetical protein